jgi:hypothetical protein
MRLSPPAAPWVALAAAIALLGVAAGARAAPPAGGPGHGADDVEPAASSPDFDPVDHDDDVEPTGGIDPRDIDPDRVPTFEEDSDLPARQDRLPPEGLAERPSLPRVGIDVLYPGSGVVGQGNGMVSLNKAGDDLFLFLNISAVFVGHGWAFGPRLPLRLRLVDRPPRTPSVIRREDWDELSDFARLLAFFQVGHPGEKYFLRIGELPGATLGHGTIINRYFNSVDIDHYQGGIYAYLDPGIVGGEVLLDNFFDPDIFAARVFLRPMNGLRSLPYALRKFKVAVSAGADFQAPVRVEEDGRDGAILVDENFRPVIADTSAMPFFGLDLEVPLVSRPHADFVPYIDLNSIDAKGAGVHIGAFLTLRFDALREWRTRLEYRYSGAKYEPDYINAFYEIHRVRYREDETKLQWLRGGGQGVGRSGFYGETEFRWAGMMNYTLVFANDEGPDNTDMMMKLELPHLGPIRLGLFFARLDFDGFKDFFGANDTVLAASIRYNFLDRFYVRFRVVNDWWLEHTEDQGARYRTKTNFDFGFGIIVRL